MQCKSRHSFDREHFVFVLFESRDKSIMRRPDWWGRFTGQIQWKVITKCTHAYAHKLRCCFYRASKQTNCDRFVLQSPKNGQLLHSHSKRCDVRVSPKISVWISCWGKQRVKILYLFFVWTFFFCVGHNLYVSLLCRFAYFFLFFGHNSITNSIQ